MPEFAKRMDYMAGSAAIIRGLFSAMNDPETISFGGGTPASDALPGHARFAAGQFTAGVSRRLR